jgi:predicted ATP-grasp superfamily ATP-dependent carboligase
MMVGKAPDIEVAVISLSESVPSQLISELAKRPTLFFSPMPISLPSNIRGRLICPPRVSTKYDEFKKLEEAGFPVPKSYLVEGVEQLRNIELEPLVVIKPNRGLRGRGVNLIRTALLKNWTQEQLERSPSNRSGMVVQQYVNMGSHPISYRVMTVLGEVIYCIKSVANTNIERLPVNLSNTGVPIASNVDDRIIVEAYDPDVIDLGRRIHQRFGFTPVMGIDIVRDVNTNELYVLELNSNGWTWHLSSDHGKEHQKRYSLNKYDQFNALKTITDKLIQETRVRAI